MPFGQSPHTAPSLGASVISFEDRLRSRREAAAQTAAAVEHAQDALVTRARVAAVTDTCWRCRQKVRAIVGVLVEPEHTADGSGFIALEQIDEALSQLLDPTTLARRGVGELRHRESPGVEGGYIANGCIECDALIGRFRIEDLFHEHRMTGAPIGRLDSGIVLYTHLQPARRRLGRSTSL